MMSSNKSNQQKMNQTAAKVKDQIVVTNKEAKVSSFIAKSEEKTSLPQQDNVNIEEESQREDAFRLKYILEYDSSKLSTRVREKVEEFKKALLGKNGIINVAQIKDICFTGIPDDVPGLRSLVWKIVIGYLPADRRKWEALNEERKETYKILLDNYLTNIQIPSDQIWAEQDEDELQYYLSRTLKLNERHPQFRKFFEDRNLWSEIEKDSTRTRAEMNFFSTQTGKQFFNPFQKDTKRQNAQENNIKNNNQEKQEIITEGGNKELNQQQQNIKKEDNIKGENERHLDVLTRILFIYAKTNIGIRYVQGMNEILAVFYHALMEDKGYSESIECDSFFCFTMIMADVRDCFLRDLDESDSGIRARIQQLNELLKKVDSYIWNSLERLKVDPHFYSLRWLMLLFTQEFELFDVMRLWDSYLSHPQKQEFLNFMCLAIIRMRRHKLLLDFSEVMQNLQKIEDLDVQQLIAIAVELFRRYKSIDDTNQ